MSKQKLRTDTTCLNCDQEVLERFCPKCGQENVISTRSFYHLFIHFFEDLTHYDNAFWRTIVNLFFKPAHLTKAYLSGKRKTYLPPIRLYIFISFVTFLFISLFPNNPIQKNEGTITSPISDIVLPVIDSLHIEEKGMDGLTNVGLLSQQNNDTLKKIIQQPKDTSLKTKTDFGYDSVTSLDSLQKNGASTQKVGATEYWLLKKWLKVKEENTDEEIREKFSQSFKNNLPKALFFFLPIFAFILMLFHRKKSWNYFDHGIFTLHYFSFLLLVNLLLFYIDKIYPLLEPTPFVEWAYLILRSAGVLWMVYYFFPAHRRMYDQPYVKSFFKCVAIIVINLVLLTFFMVVFALFTYNNIK
jgi:hypothetical protein